MAGMKKQKIGSSEDLRELHVIYPEQVKNAAEYAAWFARTANKYRVGSTLWQEAVHQLSGMIYCLQKIGIRATILWTEHDWIDAIMVDGVRYYCPEERSTTAREEGEYDRKA